MYLDRKRWYFFVAVLDISRKATAAQVGENIRYTCFLRQLLFRGSKLTEGDICDG